MIAFNDFFIGSVFGFVFLVIWFGSNHVNPLFGTFVNWFDINIRFVVFTSLVLTGSIPAMPMRAKSVVLN